MKLAAAFALAASLAACAAPAITREQAMMTPKQIADMGLTCRADTPAASAIPRTVCASDKAWAKSDAQGQETAARYIDSVEQLTDTRVLYPR